MSAKQSLIWSVEQGLSVSDAAKLHGIVRSCAYKWLDRFDEDGKEGLIERSRAPQKSPNRIPEAIVEELLALKRRYPDFGPAKLVVLLATEHGRPVMAPSTAGTLLARHGLVKRRRRARSAGPIEHPPYTVQGAGHTMTADYKGEFRMSGNAVCYPLTLADPFSRYVVAIQSLGSTQTEPAKGAFEKAFRTYGLPSQIVSDNGTPFSSTQSLGGLTRLSRWFIELGIVPVRIKPGHPEQNGSHERMHGTFKKWIQRHPKRSLRAHQQSFEAFRREFNEVRPHESLGQRTPATLFKSYRDYSTRSKRIEYDTKMQVRSVRSNGQIRWNGGLVFLSEVLHGANVGLREIDDRLWSIHYGSTQLGYLDGLTQCAQNSLPDRMTTHAGHE
jgi:transposase InsO family protein